MATSVVLRELNTVLAQSVGAKGIDASIRKTR